MSRKFGLKVQDIDVFYGIVPTLHRVCLEVDGGETVCLLGPNGAGKTTTVKTIIGLLQPRAGRIWFNETDIPGLPPHRTIGLGISLAPEGRLLFPDMSVEENLELGASTPGARSQKQSTMAWVYSLFPKLQVNTAYLSCLRSLPYPEGTCFHQVATESIFLLDMIRPIDEAIRKHYGVETYSPTAEEESEHASLPRNIVFDWTSASPERQRRAFELFGMNYALFRMFMDQFE